MNIIIKKFTQSLIILCLVATIFYQYHTEAKSFVPVSITASIATESPIKRKLNHIGVSSNPKLINAIGFASEQNNISVDLIIALTWTESQFKQNAVSSAGYKGLMQIPHAVYQSDANILIGTRILREKIDYAKGDMIKALMLYKGYPLDSDRGRDQVKKLFALYHKLKTVV